MKNQRLWMRCCRRSEGDIYYLGFWICIIILYYLELTYEPKLYDVSHLRDSIARKATADFTTDSTKGGADRVVYAAKSP
jgi:hypothetical protein